MKFYAPLTRQLDLDLFRSSLSELDTTNRWVTLGDLLPWTELEKEYNSRLYNQDKGAGNKPARMILGAMIIKHKLNLGDEETIEIIKENPYMLAHQFLGYFKHLMDNFVFCHNLVFFLLFKVSSAQSSNHPPSHRPCHHNKGCRC